ncbi:bifunctional sugar phosphate isomerase/epimerase/4-hydroxyphenylpyruvate dioxygenase family protein [Phaeacidiphilus oryzae]|uniref:bifunctional sugar phosphate isomerase/epimerase/4-hydroxyphenylpyruvate dioxygenase family protein n=1 Tax=Phaeacidiphilus oryzae TaxID=348818 RepID=UPI00056833F2|nr:sugar phosphate isomerase/epimerase and 4-hydroxyphenylpyruvate domain-containing protein [Phaeacidiphilus oryzae]
MRNSIATVSLSGTLTEKLAAASAAGFDGVEIFENDLLSCPLSPEEVRDRAADLGLRIELYQPFRDFETDDEAALAAHLRRAERKFETVRRLGADLLLVCSSVEADAPAEDARTAEQLRLLAERAQRQGVRIAYEALAWGRRVNTYPHSWRIVAAADHPALGLCLDSFHILARGGDPAGIAGIPAEKLFFLQLADAAPIAMDALQWSRHHRCFPGQGGLPVAEVVAATLRAGYRGPLSLEVFNDVFRRADAGRTAVDGLRSLLALAESATAVAGPDAPAAAAAAPAPAAQAAPAAPAAQAAQAAPATPAPSPAPALPARQAGKPEPAGPPASISPTGVAFAELAAADPEPLRSLLAALGFVRTGRHRGGKPVELWEQGEARVVLNSSADGGPHGEPRLAALGLESPDPRAAAERAEALLAPVLPRRLAPGDVPLEAVAAPDGTELFFCSTGHPERPDWRADFTDLRRTGTAPGLAGPAPGSEVGTPLVSRIDHIALTQPWHRFDEAVLFFPAVLGLRPQQSLDLADPYGLFRSRALAGPGGGLRLALNLAPGPDFDEERPQHLALAVTDLEAAVRRLRASGIATLDIPANYYDDLEARFPLPEGESAGLRELGILYDREDRGRRVSEFRHAYTAAYGRVSVELVQRGGGYRGFGAANAPVRLAAQRAARPARRP